MTSCYPNETIPWSHFPSKIPHAKTFVKIAIIMVFQVTTNRIAIMCFTGAFVIIHGLFVFLRCKGAITYDRGVHGITLYTETTMMVIFMGSLTSDLIEVPLNTSFLAGFMIFILGTILVVSYVKHKMRYLFLKKVDIFNYTKEEDALLMMVYLHELIEAS